MLFMFEMGVLVVYLGAAKFWAAPEDAILKRQSAVRMPSSRGTPSLNARAIHADRGTYVAAAAAVKQAAIRGFTNIKYCCNAASPCIKHKMSLRAGTRSVRCRKLLSSGVRFNGGPKTTVGWQKCRAVASTANAEKYVPLFAYPDVH
jgi:hypothetical protein